jgi:hypothetical protein
MRPGQNTSTKDSHCFSRSSVKRRGFPSSTEVLEALTHDTLLALQRGVRLHFAPHHSPFNVHR